MPYVAARYQGPHTTVVVATDHLGTEWHLTTDSQVGDWLMFLANPENTIAPALPIEPLPVTSVSRAQAQLALYNAGLLDDLEALIASHPYRPVRIWYESANTWERSNPYVNLLGPELNLTDEQIDDLFLQASLIL
jgi:hypothetical protein